MTIILYDIPSTAPGSAWSPNVWKVRYCLNYKKIPYKTEWIDYGEIGPFSEKQGIAPTYPAKDGKPARYTLPAIHDPSTGVSLADSLAIAEYLECAYPETPSIFPQNTKALQIGFAEAYENSTKTISRFIMLPILEQRTSPQAKEWFRADREASWKKKLEDISPRGEERVIQWAKVQSEMAIADAWLAKNDSGTLFLMGGKPVWADMVVVGWIVWLKIVFGEESEEWKDISDWHGGRWGKLVDAMRAYDQIL